MTKAVKITAVLMAAALATAGVTTAAVLGSRTEQAAPVLERPMDEQGGMQISNMNARGVSLKSEAMPLANDAESTQRLTATVTPADAENKQIDWSVAWEDPESSFAKGKDVEDYVTVTPTSDGALTADVKCLQAFGEPIIVTAAAREITSVKATVKVDYVRKFLGADYSIKTDWGGNHGVVLEWDLNYESTDVTVDYMYKTNGSWNAQELFLGYGNDNNTTVKTEHHWSDVYTINDSSFGDITFVAPTQAYLDALEEAGFNVTATAEEFININGAADEVFANFLISKFVSDAQSVNNTKMAALRAALKSRSGQEMVRIKEQVVGGHANTVYNTIYNLKFSSSSLAVQAANVTVNPGSIEF